MPPSWASPIASVSSTRPSTWPWKFPPLSTAPSAGKTSGLSETLPSSRATTAPAKASASRAAPWTCGMQRKLYASWTRVQSRCEAMIPLSAVRRRRFAADAAWPGCGRRRWIRPANAALVPIGASGVAQHEVPLELGALGGRDDDVLELADAGRDAVDRRRALGELVHEPPRRRKRTRGSGRQPGFLAAAGDGLDRLETQRAAVEIDHPLVNSPTRARSSRWSTVVRRPDATTCRPCTQTSLTARGDMA